VTQLTFNGEKVGPIFIENSKIPVWLSYISPIDIYAITLFPFVISRGTMNEETRRHETIHFQQYLETLVIGFLILYLIDYLHGMYKYRDGEAAYLSIRAEQEAYENDKDSEYLDKRKRWAWISKYHV
jgi:hypothetical protein